DAGGLVGGGGHNPVGRIVSPGGEEGGGGPAPRLYGRGGGQARRAGGRLRPTPPCPDRAEAGRRLGFGRGLDQRHLRERVEAVEAAPARGRRRYPRREHRPPLRALSDAWGSASTRPGPPPPAEAARTR